MDTRPASLNAMKQFLRIAGLLHAGEEARVALPVLAALETRLEALKEVTPNLLNTINALQAVARLKVRPPNPARFTADKVLVSKRGDSNLLQWLVAKHPNGVPKSRATLWLDVLALRWLHSACCRCFGDQFTLPSSKYVNSPAQDIRNIPAGAPIGSALTVGYPKWLEATKVHGTMPDEAYLPYIAKSLGQIDELRSPSSPKGESTSPPRLSERQLSNGYWHHIRPARHQKLIALLKRKLDPDSGAIVRKFAEERGVDHEWLYPRETYSAEYRSETCLIALSIQTGHSVPSLLSWTVHPSRTSTQISNSFQHLEAISRTYGSKYKKVTWVKHFDGPSKLEAHITLPWEVASWLSELHPGWGAHTLGDLLPHSSTPWDERVYTYLARELGCSYTEADLMCRDVLAQLIYEQSSNAVLVNFWRSDTSPKAERTERLALSHYLQPTGLRAANIFTEACTKALGEDVYRNKHSVRFPHEPKSETSYLVEKILRALEADWKDSKDIFERQNALARLTLFVFLVVTGHRRSLTPFPFPWDFSPSERLVFICDKHVTGSEARFAALPNTALAYLRRYFIGLRQTSRHLEPTSRDYAEQVLSFLSWEAEPPQTSQQTDFHPYAGVFFAINGDGRIAPKPLSTGALDQHIEALTGIPRITGKLRSMLAQHLWEKGCSGRVIQAFLGHQPELHVHGPASTWSVQDVANRVAPIIERLLVDELKCPAIEPADWHPSKHFPPLLAPLTKVNAKTKSQALGYEGRAREKIWTAHRVQMLLRQEVSERRLQAIDSGGDGVEPLDAKEKDRITERAKEELANDPLGAKSVEEALEKEMKGKEEKALTIQTAPPKYLLATPGPLDIGFSRLLRCAVVFRSVWERSVGMPIGHRNFDATESLAHLAISLVCFDAVLAKENLEKLVLSAANGDLEVFDKRITLRASVNTPTHDYEFSVRPGTLSSALIVGIARRKDADHITWPLVEQRLQVILHKLLCVGDPKNWSAARLCMVFRPFWLIRQSGAMYAVAIGDYKGPAADASSEAQLHGKRTSSRAVELELRPAASSTLDQEQKKAIDALKSLFRDSRGIFENGESRRRVQRKKLKKALDNAMDDEKLKLFSSAPIFHLLLTFIKYLVEVGGSRTEILAFSSIEKYFVWLAEFFIYEAWELDFESCDPVELTELFDTAASKNPESRVALGYFAAHLADLVPHWNPGSRWVNARAPTRIRSSLVTPKATERALQLLGTQAQTQSRHASTMIAACSGYGLRRREALGLTADQFDEFQGDHLSISRSGVADLKTPSSRRVIASFLLSDSVREHVTTAVLIARSSPRENQYLFEAENRDQRIHSERQISAAATYALRVATQNPIIVPHHLRHSFATYLGLSMLASPTKSDSVGHIAKRLVGPKYENVARAIVQCPTDWPFGLDAVATVLGHADVGTLLNTYFHASHLAIADRCKESQPSTLQQVRLGTILHVDRTTLSKQLTRLKGISQDRELGIADLVREFVGRQESEADEDDVESRASNAQFVTQWRFVCRALLNRLNNELSVAEMWAYASRHLNFAPERIKELSRRYAELVQDTGFDDFEPASSELIDAVASHRRGTERGQHERENFVAMVQKWAHSAESNWSSLEELLKIWAARVDPKSPHIVCQSLGEFQRTLDTLNAIGVRPAQLSLRTHGDELDPWLRQANANYQFESHAAARASRGSARVKMAEVSIAIQQAPGSPVPDGRDFHRSLACLYVVITKTPQSLA